MFLLMTAWRWLTFVSCLLFLFGSDLGDTFWNGWLTDISVSFFFHFPFSISNHGGSWSAILPKYNRITTVPFEWITLCLSFTIAAV